MAIETVDLCDIPLYAENIDEWDMSQPLEVVQVIERFLHMYSRVVTLNMPSYFVIVVGQPHSIMHLRTNAEPLPQKPLRVHCLVIIQGHNTCNSPILRRKPQALGRETEINIKCPLNIFGVCVGSKGGANNSSGATKADHAHAVIASVDAGGTDPQEKLQKPHKQVLCCLTPSDSLANLAARHLTSRPASEAVATAAENALEVVASRILRHPLLVRLM